MLPLLLLTTLLLPLIQGKTCLSRQDVLHIVKEMETKIEEVETKLDKKDAEMKVMKAEMEMMKEETEKMERKVESAALPGAVAEAIRNVPQLMISVYQDSWTTITYQYYMVM